MRFFLYDGDEFRPFSEGAQTVVKAGAGFNEFKFLFTVCFYICSILLHVYTIDE